MPGTVLTPADYAQKWAGRFPDNQFETVSPADFREQAADTAASFVSVDAGANNLKGGLHSVPTKTNLLAIPAELRDYGMEANVYGGAVASEQGKYQLANDLLTWVKAGTDIAGQFDAYDPAKQYNSQSAYQTYLDQVSGSVRIFHSLYVGVASTQPAPLDLSNVPSNQWEEISPSAAVPPSYDDTVLKARVSATETVANAQKTRLDTLVANADPALDVLKEIGDQLRADESGAAAILATQQQQGQQIATLSGGIIGVTTGGVQTAYATAQLAADALNAAGGGVVLSKVDIEGPLVLQNNVSLYAPGRTIYLRQNVAGDTLTLSYCTGTVECKLIERTQAGTGYALVVNYGSPTVKADTFNTRGYNAVYNNGGTVVFTGNSELTNNPTLASGERLVVLSVGGKLTYQGTITLNASGATNVVEGLTAFSGAQVEFNGIIRVTDKGRAARNQGAILSLRGRVLTNDKGVLSLSAKTDIYCSIDTRNAPAATIANAPLQVARNGATPADSYVQLHAGSELLAPAGIASVYNSNASVGTFEVFVSGTLVQTALPDANVTITYKTIQPAATGGGGSVAEQVVRTSYGTGTASPSFGAVFATGGGIAGYDSNAAYMHADSVDGYFQFTMSGDSFALWHSTYVGMLHKYDIWVDGVVVDTVNYTATSHEPIHEVYRKTGLTLGVVHTIRLISVAAYAAQLKIDQIRVRGAYTSAI